MNHADLLALVLVAIAAAFGIWIGVRIMRRAGFQAVDRSMGQRLFIAVLLTFTIVIGLWVGGRDNLSDPGAVLLGIIFGLVAMFFSFRRPKRS
ncbi:hypothetical protein [Sphingomonas alpina]|uniref:Uncharacterized protein n=1 Tax=Sphingomonas alpina TaxID=653931 RepID=A0A7H0LE12_9SPHN|nr:hypothetical protein [Sphingomonas alpina]QNQ07915.1 hypothetical protein H3Z74_14055 [Sphingomonas alpina]